MSLPTYMESTTDIPASPWPHDPAYDLSLEMQQKLPAPASVPHDSPARIFRSPATPTAQSVFFRARIVLSGRPVGAALNLTVRGTRQVFVNGRKVSEIAPEAVSYRYSNSYEISKYLTPGANVISVAEQIGAGLPGGTGFMLRVLTEDGDMHRLVSGPGWKYFQGSAPPGWETSGFDDSGWDTPPSTVLSKGVWGLAYWPEPCEHQDELRVLRIRPRDIRELGDTTRTSPIFRGLVDGSPIDAPVPPDARERFDEIAAADLPGRLAGLQAASPGFLLDFGRVVSGPLVLRSADDRPLLAVIGLGESAGEALNRPHLDLSYALVPSHGEGRGVDAGFRFARVHLIPLDNRAGTIRLAEIACDHTFYPAAYVGEFRCSDIVLERIWNMGAYTVRLNCQWAVLDGNKRDRYAFSGDLAPQQAALAVSLGDPRPARRTQEWLTRELVHNPPVAPRHINGIDTYTSLWVENLWRDFQETGDLDYVRQMSLRMIALLRRAAEDLGADGLWADRPGCWPFIDWSPGLWQRPYVAPVSDSQKRCAHFLLYMALSRGADLLGLIGAKDVAAKIDTSAHLMRTAGNAAWWDETRGEFGERPHVNALALFTGFASPEQAARLRETLRRPFSGHYFPDWRMRDQSGAERMSPYFRYYWLEAAAQSGTHCEALDVIRSLWGAMLERGATTTWENVPDIATPETIPGYGPDWVNWCANGHGPDWASDKPTPYNYGLSLSHGWSAAPTSWLTRHILGIRPGAPGYTSIQIEPILGDLIWAEGTMPTPYGTVHVRHDRTPKGLSSVITIPADTRGIYLLPAKTRECVINGAHVSGTTREHHLPAGRHVIHCLD